MIKEVKKVEAVVVYNVDLREWKGKVLKLNLIDLGVEFKKSKGALVIEANDNNVAEIERLVKQGNYKYVVDTVIEYIEVEEAEEIEMVVGTIVKVNNEELNYNGFEGVVVGEAFTSRTDGKKALIVEVEKVGQKFLEVEEVEVVETEEYLLNTDTKVISLDGDQVGANYVIVVGRVKEVEGGFKFIGKLKVSGVEVEAFLTEEQYFDGKEFVAGANAPTTLSVEEVNNLKTEANLVVESIADLTPAEALEVIDNMLAKIDAKINLITDDELRYSLRDIENHLKWVYGSLEEMVEEDVVIEDDEITQIDGFTVFGGSMVQVSTAWKLELKKLVKENDGLIRGDEVTIRVSEDPHLLDGRLKIAYLDSYNSKRVWQELDGSLSLKGYLAVKSALNHIEVNRLIKAQAEALRQELARKIKGN